MPEFINTVTLGSIWFWLILFAQWGFAIARPMGIPYSMIVDPNKGSAMVQLVQIQRDHFSVPLPLWWLAVVSFAWVLTGVVGIAFNSDLGLGVFIILIGQTLISVLNRRVAYTWKAQTERDIRKRLNNLQTWFQIIGAGIIFTSSFIAMIRSVPSFG